jgi:hypothetical protein
MPDAFESYPSCMVYPFYVASVKLSVHALIVTHLTRMAVLVEHAVVGWLDVVMTSLHIVHLVATIVRLRLARYVANGIGVTTAHAVGRKAT